MNNDGESNTSLANGLAANVETIRTHTEFSAFVTQLRANFDERPQDWQNKNLSTFLEALAGWTEDMEGYFENKGEEMPAMPTWKTFAESLLAARVYE